MFYPFWARIVALSDTCDLLSLHNFLLYTTLALSVVAVSASFVWRPQPHGCYEGKYGRNSTSKLEFVFSFFLSFFSCFLFPLSLSPKSDRDCKEWLTAVTPFPGFWFSPTVCSEIIPIRQRFLGVDYARRLAIDAAKQKGYRLVLKAKKLENTGMAELASNTCSWNLQLFVARSQIKVN